MHVNESNISRRKTGGQGYVVNVAIQYSLDSPKMISYWATYCMLLRPALDPPSLLYKGCKALTGGKVTGM